MERYDVVVIGSGMGGLAAASLLAQLSRARVLVLERHFKRGGFTHTFKRPGNFHWDVGLHYVGGLEEGGRARQLFDLVTRGGVRWKRMPDPFEVFEYPGFRFAVRAGEARFRDDLSAAFPEERVAIDAYLSDLHRAGQDYIHLHAVSRTMPWPIGAAVGLLARRREGLALQTTGLYLAQRFRDRRLRSLVASQWGDYGLPPAQSAFALHAMIATHYLEGGWYPEGTAQTIADTVSPIVREAGGDLRVNCEAKEIVVEGGRAVGVRYIQRKGGASEEKEARAEAVISDAGAATTFLGLLPSGAGPDVRNDIERLGPGYSNVTLYVGLKENPEKLGFHGENHWIYDGWDHDEMFRRQAELLHGKASHCYLSFPSMKDPLARAPTAEIIAAVPQEPFAPWRDEPWKNRGEEYEALKNRIACALLDLVESRHAGFRDLVAYQELSTPITTERFTSHAGGAIYGLPGVPERWRIPWLGARTPVKALWLAGADAVGHGIVGAMMGGVSASAGILGLRGFPRIFGAAKAFAGPRTKALGL
ncbi:MAG TPA: NAD(P)/FAD-dependent oxidoreductase [Myxococcota bacterium]|nr:NAD(P)/FAD-dependent oxidoreductase [Myxococcota bacterium]